ncbi:small ribosomal subunit protein mS39-like isoform X2 [Liolophura sinensis]
MDDPYLIPADNFNKKSFALSKASGRKAAKLLVERYGKFVKEMYDFAEPKIEAYQVKDNQYRLTDPGEDALLERVGRRRVVDAIEMFKAIQAEGGTLSDTALEALLQLVCVYNSEDPPLPLEAEEMWYRRDIEAGDKRRPVWKEGSVAEDIFSNLTEKSPMAYCSLVRAYAKYGSIETAWELYCEMKDKKIPVSLGTCNSLIRICPFASIAHEKKWERIQTLLRDIEHSGLSPNLGTFNAVLLCLSRMSRYTKSRKLSLQTLTEMKTCGIEPSLGSWTYVLRTFYDAESSQSPLLSEILNYLKDKEFTVQDQADFDFFPTAMLKCYSNLQDLELAYQLDNLLRTGDNIQFLADSGKEGSYYTNFFRLICLLEDMDTIMRSYEQFAPNIWSPTYSSLEDIFKAMELHDGYKYIPLIWSDLVLLTYYRNSELLGSLLKVMAKKQQEPELQRQLAEVARSVKDRWVKEQESSYLRPMQLTGPMMSDLITVAVRADDFDLAWEKMEIMKKESQKIAGVLSGPALTCLLDASIARGDATKAMECIRELSDQGLPDLKEAVEKTLEKLQLTELQRSELESLLR